MQARITGDAAVDRASWELLQAELGYLAAAQGHEGIVPLHGTVRFPDGTFGIVMEAAEESLQSRMER